MLDQLYGKPSISWKRTQVFLILLFWITRLKTSKSTRFTTRFNAILGRFTPYQLILSTLTMLYAIKHSDAILGLQAPEPLARLYSRNYYRATWIVTALDAGFATAMTIEPKWCRDIASVAFSVYYLLFANEADQKVRLSSRSCTVKRVTADFVHTKRERNS
jgi:hypothetical protein